MLQSAIALMQRNGAAAVTVDAVLADAGAPRGSVYYHFPGGRDEIVAEALQRAGDGLTAMMQATAAESPLHAVDSYLAYWSHDLVARDFAAGCPVVGASVSGAENDPALHDAVAAIFEQWQVVLVHSLSVWGVAEERAETLASMVVAAFEGSLILARASRSLVPLQNVAKEIRALIAAALPVADATPPAS